MTQAQPKFLSFQDYLSNQSDADQSGRYALIEGALVELPPESEPNIYVADTLQFVLAIAQVVARRLIKTHTCEIEVPILDAKDPANRFPDLVILREEHLALTRKRLTITRDMPPPAKQVFS
jgi:hypothetical protein